MAGRVNVLGLGPGGRETMTLQAADVLDHCEVIVGYSTYVALIREAYPGREILTTPMRREEERCRLALERAQEGQEVGLVCSGDPGVYGMAGLVLTLAAEFPSVEVRILPGVTAATAGAALLGAPLMHDFAVISLSDLLTPQEKIERRLVLAAQADLAIVLYNPGSHHRRDALRRACELLLQELPGERTCGLVRQIAREGESVRVCTLRELRDIPVDMFTTVFIGNSQSRVIGGRMVTPRGYSAERTKE